MTDNSSDKQQSSELEIRITTEAREFIEAAAQLLMRLGPDHKRIAWMLEDCLTFLTEAGKDPFQLTLPDAIEEVEEKSKAVNMR